MSVQTMQETKNPGRPTADPDPNATDVQGLGEGPTDRIYNAMLEAISHLSPGTKLPSEREMMERNNITRQTARVVLNRLMREGVVERKIGSGTFVSERYHQLTASHDLGEIKRLCYDFQLALAAATRNPILLANYKVLYTSRKNLGWDRLKWQHKNGNSRQELIKRQTDIFQAIKQRDRFRAVSLVLRDLDRLQTLTMGPRVLRYPKEDDDGTEML